MRPGLRRAGSRLLALLFGLLLAVAVLATLEGALRLAGVGAGERTRDPFAGFSATVPTFVPAHLPGPGPGRPGGGVDVLRVSASRASPGRRESELDDPQRRFLAAKPADGFRVFVVGGSSAAGVPYGPDYAFSGWLQQLLQGALPDRRVEVVNAAFSGYATRRVLTVVREIARYQPDLLIVYAGHNEFAERRYYAHLLDLDPRVFRLWEWAVGLRLYRVAANVLPALAADRPPVLDFQPDGGRALQMFAVLDERAQGEGYASARENAYRDLLYAFNLREMVAVTQQAGGRVLLASLSQNFADWPPGASGHAPDLSEADLARFRERAAAGDAARHAGDCEAAVSAWRDALAVDSGFAQTHYDLASCLRDLGRLDDAWREYRRASDLDRAAHGAPTAFNDVLRETARSTGSLFLDVDAALRDEGGSAGVGDDLFLDMVHPNVRAHERIARELAARLREAGIPEPADRWLPLPPLPDPAALFAGDPHLRFLEHEVRLVACRLARRDACAREAAAGMRAVEPDNPEIRVFTHGLPD